MAVNGTVSTRKTNTAKSMAFVVNTLSRKILVKKNPLKKDGVFGGHLAKSIGPKTLAGVTRRVNSRMVDIQDIVDQIFIDHYGKDKTYLGSEWDGLIEFTTLKNLAVTGFCFMTYESETKGDDSKIDLFIGCDGTSISILYEIQSRKGESICGVTVWEIQLGNEPPLFLDVGFVIPKSMYLLIGGLRKIGLDSKICKTIAAVVGNVATKDASDSELEIEEVAAALVVEPVKDIPINEGLIDTLLMVINDDPEQLVSTIFAERVKAYNINLSSDAKVILEKAVVRMIDDDLLGLTFDLIGDALYKIVNRIDNQLVEFDQIDSSDIQGHPDINTSWEVGEYLEVLVEKVKHKR